MTYTINEIAKLAGVTTRTLRYYDQIGLLSPAHTGGNGYRFYDRESLYRLQQILFFRELDVPLKEIQYILSLPDFNLTDSLEKHRKALQSRADRLAVLIQTVDQSLAALKGETKMTDQEVFKGFDESQYEEEARERWGNTDAYAQSQQRWGSFTPQQKDDVKEKMADFMRRMVGSEGQLPADPLVQAAVKEYFEFINTHFYTCDLAFYRNLADMWVQDPRFAANYDNLRAGGAAFAREAVHIFCDSQR